MCSPKLRLPALELLRPPTCAPPAPLPRSVDEGSHLDPTDQQVFMVNCLFALQAPLVGHPCAAQLAHHLG